MVQPQPRDRDFDFTLTRDATESDGLTFEGYAAVFNSPTHIRDADGEYDEVIAPGAFKQTINRSKPVLMFDHGKHPVIGQMPLGRITQLREDGRGLFVQARLSDNWMIQPVRDAVRDRAVTGMSFRFEPIKEKWSGPPSARCAHGDLRTLHEVRMPECGPVVSPAYATTTAAIRSALSSLERTMPGVLLVVRDQDGVVINDEENDPKELVEDAVEALWGLNENQSDVYTVDFFDDHAVFYVLGAKQSEYQGLWRVDYTYNNGSVTIDAPQNVKATGYVSTGAAPPTDLAAFDPNLNSAPIVGEERAKYNADDRKKMAANGQAMPDGSYPIADKEDLQNAIHAVGRGSGSHMAIRKHIVKRAKALGATDMIPADWNADGSMSGMNSQHEGPSEEATSSPSGEVAEIRPSTQAERRQLVRQLQLQRRGIHKKDLNK